MALIPTNSVGGFSTGLTMTAVIDATGNITGVSGSFTGNFSGATGSFSRLLTASAGITTSFIYASTGSTFGGTLKVVGGATFDGRVDLVGILDVGGGVTMESTLDVAGVSRFAGGVTLAGTFSGATGSFSRLLTASAGISAAGSTFSSTTNTLDVIASTEGAGLRIAKATTGANSRVGGIRLGRSGTTAQNTYLENSSGAFTVFNGVDNTANAFASFSGTAFSIGATTATQLTLNCPGTVQIGDAFGSVTLHNQKFTLDGSTRFFTFGDSNGTTAGFMGINRAYNGLCADYALEVNSPTGKGLQLIYNDHTGAASNWVNMDVSSGGNYTLRPSGGLATVTGTLNVSAGVCAAGGVTLTGRLDMNGGYSEAGATATQATNTITFNAASGNTQKFVPSAVVNTVNFTNINTISTQCTSATLIFLHGATPYGLTTGTFSVQLAGVTKTVKWSGGSAPTLTNTANKTDILNFLTYDGGTTWLGFVGGLNF